MLTNGISHIAVGVRDMGRLAPVFIAICSALR